MHETEPRRKIVESAVIRAPQRYSAKTFPGALTLAVSVVALFNSFSSFSAEATNSPASPLTLPQLPDAGPSVLRVMGALALVLGLFLGGVWLYRNWQRLTVQRGRAPKLNVLETRSLGGKHALYVIGYEQERFLLSSSPTGVALLSHLPTADGTEPADEIKKQAAPSFAQALTQVLKGK